MITYIRSRKPQVFIEVGVAILLAIIVWVVWDQIYAPTRPVAQVGAQTINRQQYQDLAELEHAQHFTFIQKEINRYEQMLSEAGAQSTDSALLVQDRQRMIQVRDGIAEDLRNLKRGQLNTGLIEQWMNQEVIFQGAAKEGVTVSDEEIQAALLKSLTMQGEDHSHEAEDEQGEAADEHAGETASITDTEQHEAPTATPGSNESAHTILVNAYTELVRILKDEYGINVSFSQEAFIAYAQRQQHVDLLSDRIAEKLIPDDQAPKTLQVHAYHLLLEVTPTMTETSAMTATEELNDPAFAEVKVQADQLYQQLKQGADFLTLAQKHSANPEETVDPGWSVPDAYWPSLKEAVLNQPLGEVGPPVKTPSGWYIVKVLEREERRDSVALAKMREEHFQQWAHEQRSTLGMRQF